MLCKECWCKNKKCDLYLKHINRYVPDLAEILIQYCKECNEALICNECKRQQQQGKQWNDLSNY
jgi:hypothetical protein